MSLKRAVLLFLGLAAAAPAAAQIEGAAVDMTGMGIYAMEDSVKQAAGGATLRASSGLRTAFTTPARGGAAAPAPYRTSPAVRQKVVDIFLRSGPKNPAYVSEIKQYVASGRVFREYAGIAPKMGLRQNDAVDAYAFYLLAQWAVANDFRGDPSRAQVAGVRAQASRALAGVSSSLASDAARQEFAETLIAQGVLMASAHGYNAARGKNDVVRMLASKARQGGVRVFNMDPTRIALTNAGFRPRG